MRCPRPCAVPVSSRPAPRARDDQAVPTDNFAVSCTSCRRDGRAKLQILRAVDRARECMPLRAVLRFLRVSPSRFQAWRRRQTACALDDQSSCPRTSPHRLMLSEVKAIGDMVTSPEYHDGRPARSPSPRSGSAPCRRRRRPGTASSGSTAGDAHGSACIPPSRRWGCARLELTRCGTSTPRHPPARRDTRLSTRRDRQLLSTDSGVARGRYVHTVSSVAVLLEASWSTTRSASAQSSWRTRAWRT